MEESDVKYCVTSFTDLLGISNHLEIGNDLRTKIGQEVINRLNVLEETIDMFLKEKKKYSKYYPKNINYRRINDSLILTLDLPEFLTPRIGETIREGLTQNELHHFFPNALDYDSFEEFDIAYNNKLTESIIELTQFIGLSGRIHSYINRKENENYFPGAKTIISSGYRKSFFTSTKQEDYFSANFSFSNAYIAESNLKGNGLFIDNNLLKLLGLNQFTRNLLKYSSFVSESNCFNPFDDEPPSIDSKAKPKMGVEKEIIIFRKKFYFREINSNRIAFLHLFSSLLPYLTGQKRLVKKKKYLFRQVFYCFLNEIKTMDILESKKHFFFFRFDIEDNIDSVRQLVLKEKSSILEKQKEEQLKRMLMKTTNIQ